ncbi:hypothetical protein BN128_2310 [Cronobacter sakazakii 696]|nr:hypothetical protein BN128_2310 [Cronobacter sakazakii 696]
MLAGSLARRAVFLAGSWQGRALLLQRRFGFNFSNFVDTAKHHE